VDIVGIEDGFGLGRHQVDGGAELIGEVVFQLHEGEEADRPGELRPAMSMPPAGGLWQVVGRLPVPPAFTPFQQIFCKMSAPAAKINGRGAAPVPTVLYR